LFPKQGPVQHSTKKAKAFVALDLDPSQDEKIGQSGANRKTKNFFKQT